MTTNTATDAVSNDSTNKTTDVSILALHGSEGTADAFQLDNWKNTTTCNWHVTSLQAPIPKGSGYAWWQLRPGERSFTAQTMYAGYETSRTLLAETIQQQHFDVMVGHSQGAILLAACVLTGADEVFAQRKCRFVWNGVAWPNPLTERIEERLSSVKENDAVSHDILLLVGQRDRINPPEQAARVREGLERAGHVVEVWEHPAGHGLPVDDASVAVIREFIERQ